MDPGLRRHDVGQGLARLKAPDQASQPSPRRRPGPITSTQARNSRNQSSPPPGRRLRARRQPIAPDPRLTRQPFTPCDKLRQICSNRSSGRKRPGPRTVSDEAVEAGFPPVARSPGGRRVKRDEREWNPRTNAPGPRVLFSWLDEAFSDAVRLLTQPVAAYLSHEPVAVDLHKPAVSMEDSISASTCLVGALGLAASEQPVGD